MKVRAASNSRVPHTNCWIASQLVLIKTKRQAPFLARNRLAFNLIFLSCLYDLRRVKFKLQKKGKKKKKKKEKKKKKRDRMGV